MPNVSENVHLQVRRHFCPELLNRLDEIVIFDPLSHEQLRKVARLQMKDVAVRLAERGVALAVTDAALDVILSLSYDPVRGSIESHSLIKEYLLAQLVDSNSVTFQFVATGVWRQADQEMDREEDSDGALQDADPRGD